MTGLVLKQYQKMELRQLLQMSIGLYQVPLLKIDAVIHEVLGNPELINSEFAQQSCKGKRSINLLNYQESVKRILGSEQKEKPTEENPTEENITNLIILGQGLEIAQLQNLAIPDVTYRVREFNDYTLDYAAHFQCSRKLRLEAIPKNVATFLQWLLKQKEWIISTLSECYAVIGREQQEFLVSLDPAKLSLLSINDLAKKTDQNYHESTYYRMLRYRTVGIETRAGNVVIPVRFLLPTNNCIFAYAAIAEINRALAEEQQTKKSLSDRELTEKTRKVVKDIVRRTIAKYRESAGVPVQRDRKIAYANGRTEAFRIRTTIETFTRRI